MILFEGNNYTVEYRNGFKAFVDGQDIRDINESVLTSETRLAYNRAKGALRNTAALTTRYNYQRCKDFCLKYFREGRQSRNAALKLRGGEQWIANVDTMYSEGVSVKVINEGGLLYVAKTDLETGEVHHKENSCISLPILFDHLKLEY